MRKKIFALILAIAMVVTMAACGSGNSKNDENNSSTETQKASKSENEAAKENEPQAESGGDSTMVGAGDVGDNHIEIKEAALATDYEGNPAIVVTYAWTNNSDDTTSALAAVHAKAFQDGVELENAIIMNQDVFDSNSYMKDVRPGTTIDVQNAFTLTSETSIVEVEIAELISFTDEKVIMNFDITGSAS